LLSPNRLEPLNAIDWDILRMDAALDEVPDPRVHCILLTGDGR
jgi:hypothetical protein